METFNFAFLSLDLELLNIKQHRYFRLANAPAPNTEYCIFILKGHVLAYKL